MTDVISFPWRLTSSGHIATVEQDSDDEHAELIAALLLTRIGERPLCPDFGVTDMVGQGLNEGELTAAIATFGPDVRLTDVNIEQTRQDTQRVTVRFE